MASKNGINFTIKFEYIGIQPAECRKQEGETDMALYRETCSLGNFSCTIRNVEPYDAEQMIAHIHEVDSESLFLAREPGEFAMSPEAERKFLEDAKNSEYDLFLVAEIHGVIIASCVARINPRKRYRHKAELAIAVQKAYWSMGIGRKLMNAVISWSKGQGLAKLELGVDTENQRALSLYSSLGFEIEGTIRKERRMADGTYRDGYRMGLMLAGQ